MSLPGADEAYTVAEVAERLRVHEQTVRLWIRPDKDGHRRLGHVRWGRQVRVTPDQLETFIAEHRQDAS